MRKRVLIAGGGVGGLSAAIHCRLAGFDVVLIEPKRLGGKAAAIEQDGFRLDPGPSILILPEIYQEVFRRAGRDPSEYLRFQRLDPVTRVYQEGREGWVDIPASAEACIELAKTISKKDAESLRRLLELVARVEPHIRKSVFQRPIHSPLQLLGPDLLAAGRRFAGKGTYKQFVDQQFESDFFRAFFYGFPSYSGNTYGSRSMSGLLIPYYMLVKGVYYAEGGVAAIPNSFLRLAKELGVQIEAGRSVQRIEDRAGRVSGVELDDGSILPCDFLVSNIDRLTTEKMLGRPVNSKPSFSYFTVHLGVKRKLPNLSHHTLLVPKDFQNGFEGLYGRKEFPEPPILYLNVTSELDPSVAPAGCTNLFVVVGSPACEAHLDWEAQTDQALAAIDLRLARLGWRIEPEDVVFRRIQTPRYFESEHGNYRGSLYGPTEEERLFGGLFPLRCRDEKIKNLFYVGGSVQPGAGMPMVTLSGKFAADLVASES